MATKFVKTKTLKPENVAIGDIVHIHADSMATFKTYVSRYNKGKELKIKFSYSPFNGAFCQAERLQDILKPLTP